MLDVTQKFSATATRIVNQCLRALFAITQHNSSSRDVELSWYRDHETVQLHIFLSRRKL